jgi:hypothetical protein
MMMKAGRMKEGLKRGVKMVGVGREYRSSKQRYGCMCGGEMMSDEDDE